MKKLWNEFDIISEKCYIQMMKSDLDLELWDKGFTTLLEIISKGRAENPNFALELYMLDEITDYEYDVDGWLEDYMDVLDMKEQHEKLQETCEALIDMFNWEKFSPTDLRFRIANMLIEQDRTEELLAYVEDWYQKEPDNAFASGGLIYARILVRDLEGAEEMVKKHITDDMECNMDTDTLFFAADLLYMVNGDTESEQKIREKIDKFEKELEECYRKCFSEDGEELDF